MDRSRTESPQIRSVGWHAASAADPIEAFSKRNLLQRFPDEHFAINERLQFHLAIIGTGGTGIHEVDFVETTVQPGRALYLSPGQVHRWRTTSDFDARLALFRDAPQGLAPAWSLAPIVVDLEPQALATITTLLDLIEDEQRRNRSQAAREVAMRSLRDLLFVRLELDRQATAGGSTLPPAYLAFRRDLDSDVNVTTTMVERSKRLGYSARTLSRVCLSVAGRTAKQLVNERIALEAQRLLSQPGATSAQVATTLGFSEQTNFAKFFRRQTGMAPTAWRAALNLG